MLATSSVDGRGGRQMHLAQPQTKISSSAHSKTVPCPAEPYSVLAAIYDRVVGDASFPNIRASFEAARRLYRLTFASAADIGCGTVTFARYLTGYGVPVFGVDGSAAMLRIAANKNRGRNVKLLHQDLRD